MNLYVVTGITRGLGKALAEAIAADRENELIAVGRAPAGAIPGGIHLHADFADTNAIERACVDIEAHVRGKRYEKAVLINNAGIVEPVGPLEAVAAEDLVRNLAVNLVAPLLLMRRFLIATEPVAPLRRIVNISSGAGRRPIFGWSGYCTAKAGLDMASRVAALEARARGLAVEVASLAPGVVDTDMQTQVRSQSPDAFVDVARFKHMKEAGELRPPADVAADILRAEREGRLAGDDAVLDLRSLGV
jgi:benzil reductase ((S)-benzoin forming)